MSLGDVCSSLFKKHAQSRSFNAEKDTLPLSRFGVIATCSSIFTSETGIMFAGWPVPYTCTLTV